MSSQLEELRQMLAPDKDSISFGEIKALHLARDRTVLNVNVSILPEEREIVARMTWDAVGKDAGIFHFPKIGDFVLVAFPDNDVDSAVVIRRLTNLDDTIPPNATSGDLVVKSREGENLWLTGQKRVNITKGDAAPDENLVLGKQLKALMQQLLQTLSQETHVCGPPGYNSSPPNQAADYNNMKASPVDDDAMLSDVSFTEKGE